MKLPEGFRLRKGDTVALRGTVVFDVDEGDANVHVCVDGASYSKPSVSLDKVEFLRREWEVGDFVRNANDYDDVGNVVAALDGMAWVKLRSGAFVTYSGADLEPAVKTGAWGGTIRAPGTIEIEVEPAAPNHPSVQENQK